MLGDRQHPVNTTTDPFASLSQFPHPSKMHPTDNDDRSSISTSDNDDSCSVQLSNEKILKPGLPPGKKTRGRVKIEMQYIQNKLRRYTTFSKRKSGIMKKAYELSTLTGTQVMLLVASETGHVYTFATPKLQPMITSEAGKALIQTCLHQPDPPNTNIGEYDMRMSATGFEETELGYQLPEDVEYKASIGDPMVSAATPMHTIVNPPIVTIPHGVMPMAGFHAHMPECAPVPISSVQTISPHHSSPPPVYSPPHQQPGSPHKAYGSPYPGSPQAGMQPCMMEELGSPSLTHHHVTAGTMVETYVDRSPSRSPIQQHKFHASQGLYTNSPQAIRI